MDLVNGLVRWLFGVLLVPLEMVGDEFSIVVVSGVFGVLALIAFKHISWQAGIKRTKDRIKGHLIEIRIYQDDLMVVGRAVGRILFRNAQYLGLNFGPFVPLAVPFVLVAAQLVTRYGFEPLPVEPAETRHGHVLEIAMSAGHDADVVGMRIEWPEGLVPVSPLVRAPSDGRAFQEFVAVAPGEYDVPIELADGTRVTKRIVAGDVEPRALQPERVKSFWSQWLWPAEDSLAGTSFERIALTYPERELAWMPDGPIGVMIALIVASMAFGFALLKPLGIQI